MCEIHDVTKLLKALKQTLKKVFIHCKLEKKAFIHTKNTKKLTQF